MRSFSITDYRFHNEQLHCTVTLNDLSQPIVTNSRAKPQQTPSVEKHAHPPRVVYCAIYLTLTRITKFRVSNLHITTRKYTANTLHQRILQGRLFRYITSPSVKTRPESWPGDYMGKATPVWQLSLSHRSHQM